MGQARHQVAGYIAKDKPSPGRAAIFSLFVAIGCFLRAPKNIHARPHFILGFLMVRLRRVP